MARAGPSCLPSWLQRPGSRETKIPGPWEERGLSQPPQEVGVGDKADAARSRGRRFSLEKSVFSVQLKKELKVFLIMFCDEEPERQRLPHLRVLRVPRPRAGVSCRRHSPPYPHAVLSCQRLRHWHQLGSVCRGTGERAMLSPRSSAGRARAWPRPGSRPSRRVSAGPAVWLSPAGMGGGQSPGREGERPF